MSAPKKIIHEKPLYGLPSIHPGSRIVVWNHFDDKIVFVGKITRILNLQEAVGENYVVGSNNNGRLTNTTRLNLAKIGLVPLNAESAQLAPWLRTFALPFELAPAEYERFQVTFKTPAQIKRTEAAREERLRPKTIVVTLVDI